MESDIVYNATFSAARLEGLPNLWVECDGIRIESNIGFTFITDICRALRSAGRPDGAIVFFQAGRSTPSYRFRSVFESADRADVLVRKSSPLARPRDPTMTDRSTDTVRETVYRALIQIRAATDGQAWQAIHGHTRRSVLDRRLVEVIKDEARVTDLGLAAIAQYDATINYPDVATASLDALTWAAAAIGLRSGKGSLRRTLVFVDNLIAARSLEVIEGMASMVFGRLPRSLTQSEDMQKRRLIAEIINAGKLAEVM